MALNQWQTSYTHLRLILSRDPLNTYWTRPSPISSLLGPDKVILGEAKLNPILICTDAINWMLDEVKSISFIIPKKSVLINKLLGRGLCLPK